MKTSNIILLTLIGSITFFLIAGMLQLRFTGKKRVYAEVLLSSETLPEFSHLVIRRSVNLSIVPATHTRIVVKGGKTSATPDVKYHQRGDTLFIERIRMADNDWTLAVTIETPAENIRHISATDTRFALMNFAADSLLVDLKNSRLSIHGDRLMKVDYLKLSGSDDSNFYTSKIEIGRVDVYLERSQARMPGPIQTLRRSLHGNSTLFAPKVLDLGLTKDSSSRLQ